MLAMYTKLCSVTAVGLTMLKAVSGAAARCISLPFSQLQRLVELGLAVFTEAGWRGTGRHNASFISSDMSSFVVKLQSCIPLALIGECRNGMTMDVRARRNGCFG